MAAPCRRDIVVIGGSAGAISALRNLLALLPQPCPAAILVALHVAPGAPDVLPAILDCAGALPARPARDGAAIRHGFVTVGPPDHHLIVSAEGIRLSRGPRENRHRPSIDVLFRSAAVAHGPRVIGVLLSGMLDDGVAGLLAIKRRGGLALVQDPDEAEYPELPRNALGIAGDEARATLAEIAGRL